MKTCQKPSVMEERERRALLRLITWATYGTLYPMNSRTYGDGSVLWCSMKVEWFLSKECAPRGFSNGYVSRALWIQLFHRLKVDAISWPYNLMVTHNISEHNRTRVCTGRKSRPNVKNIRPRKGPREEHTRPTVWASIENFPSKPRSSTLVPYQKVWVSVRMCVSVTTITLDQPIFFKLCGRAHLVITKAKFEN